MPPKMVHNVLVYRVEFRYIENNIVYHGDWHDSKEYVQMWVDFGNKEWSHKVNHWIGEKINNID
jgi:hypothetical protein